jgi:hypothetical protein
MKGRAACSKVPSVARDGSMRKSIERALLDHLKGKDDLTGYLLVTLQNGKADVVSWADADDRKAQELTEGIRTAILDLEVPEHDATDGIGDCRGRA